jgi:hypothetical protein
MSHHRNRVPASQVEHVSFHGIRRIVAPALADATLPATQSLVASVVLGLLPLARKHATPTVILVLPGSRQWPKLRKLVFTIAYSDLRAPLPLLRSSGPRNTVARFHLAVHTESGEIKLLANYDDVREAAARRGLPSVSNIRCFQDKLLKDASGRRPVIDEQGETVYEDTRSYCDFERLLLALQQLDGLTLNGTLNGASHPVAVSFGFSSGVPPPSSDHAALFELAARHFPDRPDRSRSPLGDRTPSSVSTTFGLPEEPEDQQ